MLLEILVSAFFLKALYPESDFARCLTFALVFLAARVALCFIGASIDPDADPLWARVNRRWSLVPSLDYMYGSWWAASAQYVALLLWLPRVVEALLPGAFGTAWTAEASAPETAAEAAPAAADADDEPHTFHELEAELARAYPGLTAWVVFDSDRLPIWRFGREVSVLELTPQIQRHLDSVCQPLLQVGDGRSLRQGMFETDSGLCLLASLPGDFLFSSLWRSEAPLPPRAMFQDIVERVESWLCVRFTDFLQPPHEARGR